MILYKYLPGNINSIKSLAIPGLWCDHPRAMNDPFECLGYGPARYNKNDLNALRGKLKTMTGKFAGELRRMDDAKVIALVSGWRNSAIEKFAFCSLSERRDNLLMWSHYAEAHAGFLLGVEFEDDVSGHLVRMRYQKSVPKINLCEWAQFMNADSDDIRFALRGLSVKTPEWSYEEEWRIWRKEPRYYRLDWNQIREVYFGVNMPLDLKVAVMKMTDALGENFSYRQLDKRFNPTKLVNGTVYHN
jgi:hypothetical protein